MNDEHDELGEGHSVAAWTSVVVMLIGFTVATVALFLDAYTIVYISAGVIVVGALLWPILSKLGFGTSGPRYVAKSDAR